MGLAFPLAFYMYLGSTDAIPLSEETNRPRVRVPRAVVGVILASIVVYAFLTWAAGVGFGWDLNRYAAAEFPMIDAVQAQFGHLRFLLYLAGWTSTVALVLSAHNAGSRVLFSAAREGLLPKVFSSMSRRWRTPVFSLVFGVAVNFAIGLATGLWLGPEKAFGYTAALGTLSSMFVYVALNLSVIVFFWREARSEFSVLWHGLVPILGVVLLMIPIYSLFKPGTPMPRAAFPYVSLFFILCGVVYAVYLHRSGRTLRPGTILADSHQDPA